MSARRTANPLRGETDIQIGDQTLLLRPSFENLVAAEQELGSLFAMVERASEGGMTIADMTALLWHCSAVEDRPEREAIGNALIKMGLIAATAPVRAILAQVLQGQK